VEKIALIRKLIIEINKEQLVEINANNTLMTGS